MLDFSAPFSIQVLNAAALRQSFGAFPKRLPAHVLCYAVCGEASFYAGFRPNRVGAGHFLALSAQQIVRLESVSDDFEGYWLGFERGRLLFAEQHALPFLERSAPTAFAVPERQQPFVELLLGNMCEIAADKILCINYLQGLILQMQHFTSTATPPQTAAEQIAHRFCALLADAPLAETNLDKYAHWLGITPNHLNKCTRLVWQRSASDLLAEAILLQAQVRLRESGENIQTIAESLGFCDGSYFGRFFKKKTALSPLEYRRLD